MMLRPGFVAPKAAAAAFPVVQSRATYNETGGNHGTHDVTLPSGITAGDLLVAVSAGTEGRSITATGWTFSDPVTSSGNVGIIVGYKTATGSEGSTETFSTVSTHLNVIVLRISGWGAVEFGTPVTSTGSQPNPPSFTPSWGAVNTLWIACAALQGTGVSVSSYPSGYSNGQVVTTTGYDHNYSTATAERQLNASSEDPGIFTFSGGNPWVAVTVAVKPA